MFTPSGFTEVVVDCCLCKCRDKWLEAATSNTLQSNGTEIAEDTEEQV